MLLYPSTLLSFSLFTPFIYLIISSIYSPLSATSTLHASSAPNRNPARMTAEKARGELGATNAFPSTTEDAPRNDDILATRLRSKRSLIADSWIRKILDNGFLRRCWEVFSWTPPRCRWDPENPPRFSMALNLLFGFAATFTVANLYYNHPILNILADEFHVTYEQAATIPTAMQGGYAAGLLFLGPLGDVFRRRAFVLTLVCFTATLWLGLCLTNSFSLFVALSFLTAISTVTPQLMLPLVGDLAPIAKRATALSIVTSGLMLGMLLARVLSGILTEYTSWRTVYWLSFGLQYLILILLWLFMPDYPVTNPGGLNYFHIFYSILQMLTHEPVLVQACLTGLLTSTIFTSYWTTLTFLLASPPYSYSPLIIGSFAFIGIFALAIGPLFARTVIDRHVPLFSVILGQFTCLIGLIIGTYTGTFTVAGPIIQAFTIDIGIQASQVANRSAIYAIAPKARNRVNTAYMVSVFAGQIIGTVVGNRLYAQGGWLASGSASIGFTVASLLVCFVRAPWETHWVGWRGGWALRRRDLGHNVVQQEGLVGVVVEDRIERGEIQVDILENEDKEKKGERKREEEELKQEIAKKSSTEDDDIRTSTSQDIEVSKEAG